MHENHRDRMRKRYHVSGFDSFSEHEILEMILYHSIPRGDTNELAHTLIERFGGFGGVVEASADELKSVKGVGESSAMLIKLIEASVRAYMISCSQEKLRYNTLSSVLKFSWPRFLGFSNERIYGMFFDNQMSVLDFTYLSEGTVNTASVEVRRIAELAIAKKASSVVLVHNHPHGIAKASPNDILMTKRLLMGLSVFDIPLVEHLIIAGENFYPIVRRHCWGEFEETWESQRLLNSGFDPDEFYDVDEKTYSMQELSKTVVKK